VECESHISNNTHLVLADKRGLALILRNKKIENFNNSDEDEILQAARLIGAEYAVFIEFSKRGENYRYFLQTFNVENSDIVGMQSLRVGLDEILADFTGEEYISQNKKLTAQKAEEEANELAKVKAMLAQIDQKLDAEKTKADVVVVERGRDEEIEKMRIELDELKAAAAKSQESKKDTLPRSRFFMAYRYQITSVLDGTGLMNGIEIELGGLKRDIRIFSGTMSFASGKNNFKDNYYYYYSGYYPNPPIETYRSDLSWGGGFFFAPRIVVVKEFFKFVPGMNVGYWFSSKSTDLYGEYYDPNYYNWNGSSWTYGGYRTGYDYNHDMAMYWGGPDFRLMFGWKRAYIDVQWKMQFGMRENYELVPYYSGYSSSYGSEYRLYEEYRPQFDTRHFFGIGLSFAPGKGNWK
jgi:hypothetical protein